MAYIIPREQLSNGTLFQGGMYGDIPISFFWVDAEPGQGPRLHVHPYEEIFIVQEGQATFTLGDTTLQAEAGQIVIGPANVAHKFVNSGSAILRMVNIHPSQQIVQQWLEN